MNIDTAGPASPAATAPYAAARNNDRLTELLAYWREVVEGRITPVAAEPVEETEQHLCSAEARLGGGFSKVARNEAHFVSRCALDHPGEHILGYQTDDGWAIIGVGADEVAWFEEHFLDEMSRKAQVWYPAEFRPADFGFRP